MVKIDRLNTGVDRMDRETNVKTEAVDSLTTGSPLFSVIIPLYNHERYIRQAVNSVLNQTVSDFELIIINDGSTDGSEAVVRQINDRRIQYYSQENRGVSETINRGIKLSRGKFIAILNSDDVFSPDRLKTATDTIESDDELQAVFSHLEIIDENGETAGGINGAEDNWKEKDSAFSFREENNIVLDLLSGNFLITTSNLFCRRSVFKRVGYFRGFKYAQDYDFFLRLCCECKTCVIKKPLVKYRHHGLNTINENLPETYFEVGMVLSDFFLNHDLDKIIPGGDVWTNIVAFFNSVKTFNSDRMIMTLMLFGLKGGKAGDLVENLAFDTKTGTLFKKFCLEYHNQRIDEWNESQKAWKKLAELGEKLAEALSELNETKNELAATNYKLSAAENHVRLLLNSKAYRLGRAISWPLRKLAGRN